MSCYICFCFKGALTFNEKLTSLGRALSNLPVEVSLAKALVIGAATLPPHKRDSALALAAALGIRSIYTTRAHRDFECEVCMLVIVFLGHSASAQGA